MKDYKSEKQQKSKKNISDRCKKKIKSGIKLGGCESDLWKHWGEVRGVC